MLVFLPTILIAGLQIANAFTLGILIGYFFYAITHHAIHHWHTNNNNNWLKRRKHWHARHHHNPQIPNYGVTTTFWDDAFSTY